MSAEQSDTVSTVGGMSENTNRPKRLILINQTVCDGPLLRFLKRDEKNKISPVLQGRIRNQDGILPRSVVFKGNTRRNAQRSDWITEVYYGVSLLEDHVSKRRMPYLVSFYMRRTQLKNLRRVPIDNTRKQGDTETKVNLPKELGQGSQSTDDQPKISGCAEVSDGALPNDQVSSADKIPTSILCRPKSTTNVRPSISREKLKCKSEFLRYSVKTEFTFTEIPKGSRVYRMHLEEDNGMERPENAKLWTPKTPMIIYSHSARDYVQGIMQASRPVILRAFTKTDCNPELDELSEELTFNHMKAVASICAVTDGRSLKGRAMEPYRGARNVEVLCIGTLIAQIFRKVHKLDIQLLTSIDAPYFVHNNEMLSGRSAVLGLNEKSPEAQKSRPQGKQGQGEMSLDTRNTNQFQEDRRETNVPKPPDQPQANPADQLQNNGADQPQVSRAYQLQTTLAEQPQANVADQKEAKLAEQPHANVTDQNEAKLAEQPKENVADQNEAKLAEQPQANVFDQTEAKLAEQPQENVTGQNETKPAEQPQTNVADRNEAKLAEEPQANVSDRNEAELAEESQANVSDRNESELAEESQANVADQSPTELAIGYLQGATTGQIKEAIGQQHEMDSDRCSAQNAGQPWAKLVGQSKGETDGQAAETCGPCGEVEGHRSEMDGHCIELKRQLQVFVLDHSQKDTGRYQTSTKSHNEPVVKSDENGRADSNIKGQPKPSGVRKLFKIMRNLRSRRRCKNVQGDNRVTVEDKEPQVVDTQTERNTASDLTGADNSFGSYSMEDSRKEGKQKPRWSSRLFCWCCGTKGDEE